MVQLGRKYLKVLLLRRIEEAWALFLICEILGSGTPYTNPLKKRRGSSANIMFSGESGVVQILTLDSEKKLFKYRLKKPGGLPVNN